jgi:hypothetical protein
MKAGRVAGRHSWACWLGSVGVGAVPNLCLLLRCRQDLPSLFDMTQDRGRSSVVQMPLKFIPKATNCVRGKAYGAGLEPCPDLKARRHNCHSQRLAHHRHGQTSCKQQLEQPYFNIPRSSNHTLILNTTATLYLNFQHTRNNNLTLIFSP